MQLQMLFNVIIFRLSPKYLLKNLKLEMYAWVKKYIACLNLSFAIILWLQAVNPNSH